MSVYKYDNASTQRARQITDYTSTHNLSITTGLFRKVLTQRAFLKVASTGIVSSGEIMASSRARLGTARER